jgi:hypothetical protein
MIFAGQTSLLSDSFILQNHGNTVDAKLNVRDMEKFQMRVFPNPFTPATTISFSGIAKTGNMSLTIYSLNGKLVADLSSFLKAGVKSVNWSPLGLGSGVYIVRLNSGNAVKQQKTLLVK